MGIQTRYIEHIGTVASLRIYWHELRDGKNVNCPAGGSYHDARFEIARSDNKWDEKLGGTLEDHRDDPRWPVKCDGCGKLAPLAPYENSLEIVTHQIFRRKLFNTKSGEPEPGDLYYVDYGCWEDDRQYCVSGWSNCSGKHLHCVLPNKTTWDIDSRASNCTRREDKTHRCWVRHGIPEKGEIIHVDKNGNTCQAGAGSIAVTGFHGFLHNGILAPC